MRALLFIMLLAVTPAFGWDPPVSGEKKREHADWIGRGVIRNKTFVRSTGEAYLWKATLAVSKTIKGKPLQELEFYFEQGHGLPSGGRFMAVFRCPPFPRVAEGDSVMVYLEATRLRLQDEECLFLNGNGMIRPAPSTPSTTAPRLPSPVHRDSPGSARD